MFTISQTKYNSKDISTVSLEALVDEHKPDEQVAATVVDRAEKRASGAMVSDALNRFYVTNYEFK